MVYISFGTITFISPAQMTEMAQALQHLDMPALWTVPKWMQEHLPEEIFSAMSKQFERPGQKMIILPFSGENPQSLILSHPATSVFISHCGWNSGHGRSGRRGAGGGVANDF